VQLARHPETAERTGIELDNRGGMLSKMTKAEQEQKV
jgi:hypothetical protein